MIKRGLMILYCGIIVGCADSRILDEQCSPGLSQLHMGKNVDGLYGSLVGVSRVQIALMTHIDGRIWVTIQNETDMGPLSRKTVSGELINGCIYLNEAIEMPYFGKDAFRKHLYLLNIDGVIAITGNNHINLNFIQSETIDDVFAKNRDAEMVMKWMDRNVKDVVAPEYHEMPNVTNGDIGRLLDGMPIKECTQQVDSAEPSTNAVPPSAPAGSAR